MASGCLIGYTGFVGGNLASQRAFDDLYRSADIGGIRGKHYERIVCAGASAAKYIANRDPEADLAAVNRLLEPLGTVTADMFVLISTVDVFPDPVGVDEGSAPGAPAHAYGANRRLIEEFVRQRFPRHLILRLPGLFGPGLKKNALYDLMHDNGIGKLNPDSRYQYYDLGRLSGDIAKAESAGLDLLHLATEPVATSEIVSAFFPGKRVGAEAPAAVSYDLRSRHAGLWGREGPYLYGKAEVLRDLASFLGAR